MNVSFNTRKSFKTAIRTILETSYDRWPDPAIYAENINGEMIFDSSNLPAMPNGATLWMVVQPDSFGELSGNPEDDSLGIEINCFDQAVIDIQQIHENQNDYYSN